MQITAEIMQNMAGRIVKKFNPKKIILFGSQARGNAGPDSDVDLLVVMDCAHDKKRDMQVAIRKELRDFILPKDIIVANLEDIDRSKGAWWTVYYPAIETGKVLYEQ